MATIFLQWMFFALSAFHPFYVSMTEINHNASTKEIEVSVRIFTDDFETVLHNNYKEKIDLTTGTSQPEMNRVVNDYIQKHLQIQADGKPLALHFLGFEQQSESTWAYFEVKNIATVKQLAITNSILLDYRKEQINMLHVKANGKQQSDKLDYPDTNARFSF